MENGRDSFFGSPYKPGQAHKIPKPDLKIVEEIVVDSITGDVVTMHIVKSGAKVIYNKSNRVACDEYGNSVTVPCDIDCNDYWMRLRLSNIFEHIHEKLEGYKC